MSPPDLLTILIRAVFALILTLALVLVAARFFRKKGTQVSTGAALGRGVLLGLAGFGFGELLVRSLFVFNT